MFEIALRFGSFKVLGAFLLAGAGGFLVAVWVLRRLAAARHMALAAAAFGLANLAVLAAWAATVRVDSDEVEHLHCAWLVAQGLAPFRDFWQAHSPMAWYLLAPLVSRFHSAAVLNFARVLAGCLYLLIGGATVWLAWRVFRDRAAAVLAGLVVLMLGVRVEAAWLRPDQLATLLVLLSLALACSPALSRRNALAAGAAFGLALSLTPKPFAAALAFPLALLFSADVPWARKLGLSLFYLLGGIAGLAPLLVALEAQGIFSDWVTWTFIHHAGQARVEAAFPAALALAAGTACAVLVARQRNFGLLLVAAAFLLQTLGSALIPYRVPADLMVWVALGGVLAARLVAEWIRAGGQAGRPVPTGRPVLTLLAAAFFVLLQMEAVAPLVTRRTLGNFAADRARLNWMIEQARARPVVLVTPVHNIFSRDATRLYHLWQYNHWAYHPMVSRSLAGFARQILETKPALVAAAPRRLTDDPEPNPESRPRLVQMMFDAGVITPAEGEALLRLFNESYELRQAYGEQFYVRVR